MISAVLLTACSTATTPGHASQPSSAASAKPSLVYAAIGASETLGIGARQPTSESWPQVFYRTALPQAAVYYNFGVSGDTVSGAMTDQAPEALGIDPTLVTVWLNVNDLLAGVPAARYHDQLEKLVHDLRRGGMARVLVANVPAIDHLPAYLACHGGPTSSTVACPASPVAHLAAPALNAIVDAYNAAIADVVRREGAILVDLHSRGETPVSHPEWVSADGFHPSTAGYAQIARAFADQYRLLASR
ncbi:MAG: SGNH/GDSL hydrolase family protein [Candidatus Dormibacteraeota bacterium]|nr:SGNH/GDSL hydrolase family protein [Candidatus Dormibacteraeota bacterium]